MIQMTERTIEIWWPRATAALAAVVGWAALRHFGWSFESNRPYFMLGGVTFGAILAGFVTTNFSIVLSLKSELMNDLKETPFYALLIDYFQSSLWSAVALAALGLAALFFIEWLPQKGSGAHLFGAIWLGVLVWTVCNFIRACKISVILFKKANAKANSPEQKQE